MTKKIDSKKLPKIKVTSAEEVETPVKAEKHAPKISVASSTKAKETAYVDVDDEITSIIDKVTSSKSDIVALVLPKRAAMLQSVVNMKLLKRSADQTGKNLVLVTTEATLLPLAGLVGLHVASTPTSKPAIPAGPKVPSDEPEQIDEPVSVADGTADEADADDEDFDQSAVAGTPVGVLAGANEDETESVELPNEDEDLDSQGKPNVVPVAKQKRDKKLAVPNFDSFRTKLLLGFLGIILLGGLYYLMFSVLPRATIAIDSETSTINSNFSMTLDTKATTLNESNRTVPATAQTLTKTGSQAAPATGQQNNGEKASGKITVTNCTDNSISVATGTSFVRDGKTYISTEGANVPGSNFTSGGNCKEDGKRTVAVVALKGGSAFNISSGAYSFAGSSSDVSAYGSSMSGGTDSIVKVVSQSDIDGAKAKIAGQNTDQIKRELETGLSAKGLMPIGVTFKAGDEQVSSSVKAGERADSVTVTTTTQYSMLGAKKTDIVTLVTTNVKKQINEDKQKILKDGVDKAQFSLEGDATATTASVDVKAKSVAGPFIDIAEVKEKAKGKKEASIRGDLQDIPGVTDVEVHYSPFWVSKAPKDVNKIKVELSKITE